MKTWIKGGLIGVLISLIYGFLEGDILGTISFIWGSFSYLLPLGIIFLVLFVTFYFGGYFLMGSLGGIVYEKLRNNGFNGSPLWLKVGIFFLIPPFLLILIYLITGGGILRSINLYLFFGTLAFWGGALIGLIVSEIRGKKK